MSYNSMLDNNHPIHVLCDEHTLTPPRYGDKLILHTDASMLGLGAVLSVERKGEELPVAYFSKRLTAAEKNYSASELEYIAVVKAVDHYAIHLLGQEFTVITDHRALTSSTLKCKAMEIQCHPFNKPSLLLKISWSSSSWILKLVVYYILIN